MTPGRLTEANKIDSEIKELKLNLGYLVDHIQAEKKSPNLVEIRVHRGPLNLSVHLSQDTKRMLLEFMAIDVRRQLGQAEQAFMEV